MGEDETWGDYLERLHSENIEPGSTEPEGGLSEDDLDQIQALFQEVAQDLDPNDSDHGEGAEIDYDHLREIVRDEVRQALEELIR